MRNISVILLCALCLPISAMAARNDLFITVDIKGHPVTFTDIWRTAWYTIYVEQAVTGGMAEGYKDASGQLTGRFGPEDPVTIAQTLRIAEQAAGYSLDVTDSGAVWYTPNIIIAKALNVRILQSQPDMNRPATRAEVAGIFTDVFGVDTTVPVGNRYDDVTDQTPFATSIETFSRAGIVAGDTDINGRDIKRFRPNDSINRAEAMKIAVLSQGRYGLPGKNVILQVLPPAASSSSADSAPPPAAQPTDSSSQPALQDLFPGPQQPSDAPPSGSQNPVPAGS